MTSRIFSNLRSFVNKSSAALVVLLVLVSFVAPVLAHAQAAAWQVDERHSVARLSLGSGPSASEVGVARVNGNVFISASDPAVALEITPGDPAGNGGAEITFTSQQATLNPDGTLLVSGDLAVKRTTPSVTSDPNEGYSGPVYGNPVTYTDSRLVTLVFIPERRSAAGAETLSASVTFSREGFPELVEALSSGAWPAQLVNDVKCSTPSTVGEDFSGPACTGTIIASVRSNNLVVQGTPGAEDYSGLRAALAPSHNLGTIVLDLELKPTSTVAAVETSSTKPAAK